MIKTFTQVQLESLEPRYRTRVINSLSGFKSANLIGTANAKGHENLAIVSSVVHLGANPPLVGLVMRPNVVPRHTYDNIVETGVFTVNQVSADFWQAAHQTSARYSQAQNEFTHVDLNAEYINDFGAPFVAESQLKYAVKLVEIQHINANNTEFIIGEIEHIHTLDSAIRNDGYIDIEALNTVAVSGLDSYHVTHRLARLSYAKPDKPIHELNLNGEPLEAFDNHYVVIKD